MHSSRRQFIIGAAGAAAGLILPRFYDQVIAHIDRNGRPLILTPERFGGDLFAVTDRDGGYELFLGEPDGQPPEMTIRQFAEEHYNSLIEYEEHWYGAPDDVPDYDPESLMDRESVAEFWSRGNSPNADAYHYLSRLQLGPDLTGDKAVGEIQFIDGSMPGADYLGARAVDDVSLSLLQQRLNDLETGIRVCLQA